MTAEKEMWPREKKPPKLKLAEDEEARWLYEVKGRVLTDKQREANKKAA